MAMDARACAVATVGGAIGIVNATATGIGCALGVVHGLQATWRWDDSGVFSFQGACDDRVAAACFQAHGHGRGAFASTLAHWPHARGLKTSSQAAAALGAASRGKVPDASGIAEDVALARAAGVTLTGAWDDQWAVVAGGCHLVDNAAGRRIARIPHAGFQVAVWVPDDEISKSRVAGVDVLDAAPGAARAVRHAGNGELAAAMRENTRAFLPVYEAAGLPVTWEPVQRALAAGARAAGLSGTGPAVAALFDRHCALPPVDGGTWCWTRTRREGRPPAMPCPVTLHELEAQA